VIVTALMNPLYSWPHLGSMWSGATVTEKAEDAPTPGRISGDATPGTTLVNLTSGGVKNAETARV
jgi:hypothetical protein